MGIRNSSLVQNQVSESNPRPQVLVVSSSVLCGSKECQEKHWIRQNSFHNWMDSGFEVLVLVDHGNDCEKLADTVTCMEHDCWHDSLGLPKVGCLIHDSLEQYPEYIVVFTNDDISFRGLVETIDELNRTFDQYVALGRRTNVPLACIFTNQTIDDVTPTIDIDTIDCDQEFRESDAFELDYFVFKIGASVLNDYPDFLLGNWRWDNMMVDYLLMKNVTLVDVSKSVTAYHLGKTATSQEARHGAKYNDDLMKTYLMNTEDDITGNEGRHNPVVRFGFMDNAQYESRRGNSSSTSGSGSDTDSSSSSSSGGGGGHGIEIVPRTRSNVLRRLYK